MIELRGLHLGNMARSPDESVRPDLWPDWAVIPILGRTGGRLVVLDSGGWTLRSAVGISRWTENGYIATTGQGRLLEPIVQASNELTLSIAGIWDDLYTLPMCLTVGNVGVNNRFCGLASTSDAVMVFLYTDIYFDAPSPRPPTGQIALSGTVTGSARQLWRNGTIAATDTRSDEVNFAGPIHVGVHVYARSPSPPTYADGGTTSVATVHWRKLAPTEIIDLHSDPLLPFRRRQPAYYSVPSGGWSTDTPAAMMMGI